MGYVKPENKLCIDEVDWKSIVYYDETSESCLRWKEARVNKNGRVLAEKDSKVGTRTASRDYYQVNTSVGRYLVHRVIWVLHNGIIPDDIFVDHIDGNRANNRLSNLRLVTKEGNARNAKLSKASQTGVTGVTITTINGVRRYTAYFVEGGKTVRKYFRVDVYGEEGAFTLAKEFRESNIKRLNEHLGYGYTDNRGKR